jgi:predicted enzyme involved in methoxymalonyl-ACP biosynthesis
VTALRGWGIERGVDFQIYEADIGQIDMQVMDVSSALYEFRPEYVVILPSPYNQHKKFAASRPEERDKFATNYLFWIGELYRTLIQNCKAKLVISNLPLFDDGVFGSYGNKVRQSWVHRSRLINSDLMQFAAGAENLFIADFDLIRVPNVFDIRMKVNADMDYSIDFLPPAARSIADIILSAQGILKKCVIVDLDNTMWGGVIGDDGIENIQIGELGIGKAFGNLQRWLKQLKERGILLCVCRNSAGAVREASRHDFASR